MTPEERKEFDALKRRVAALEERLDAMSVMDVVVDELIQMSWEDTHRAFVPEARRLAGEG